MSVLIAHASIDERGQVSGGKAGDQNGKEVCTRAYYKDKYTCILRPNNSELAEKSAKFVEGVCGNPNVGYNQWKRNTLYTQANKVGFVAEKIETPCDCDCSSFMHTAAIAGGANIPYILNGATTRTMKKTFTSSGFYTELTDTMYLTSDDYLKRGDIVLKAGYHTFMVLEDGAMVNPNTMIANVTYAVKLKNGRVLPAVKNLDDYAGIQGKEIVGLAIKVDNGRIKYQVHTLNGKWLPWVTGYDWNDSKNGYAGDGNVIDAIRVYYSTPDIIAKNRGYLEAVYRVSTTSKTTYYDWQHDDSTKNGMDGYAGCFGKPIDILQIQIS